MHKIEQTTKLVKNTLETHPQTRNSDNYLYYIICKGQLEKQGLDIEKISLSSGLLHRGKLALPPFETVRRARQKLQARCPHLAALPEVEAARLAEEEKFREFARN